MADITQIKLPVPVAKKTTKSKPTMVVKVHAPFRTYYNGEAESISAVNGTGPFDILPKHHNFMTLLLPGDIVVRTPESEEKKITITRGIMHVKADKVIVFLDV